MAAIAITEPVDGGDVDGLVQKLNNEMELLLDGAGVPKEVQDKLAQCCMRSALFSFLACGRGDKRTVRADHHTSIMDLHVCTRALCTDICEKSGKRKAVAVSEGQSRELINWVSHGQVSGRKGEGTGLGVTGLSWEMREGG